MSQVTRLFTTAVVAVALTIVAMLFVARPASAQVGRTVVCTGTAQLAGSSDWERPVWMNAQLKAGKTQFIQIGAMFCAW
jgi:hypothetical protein